MKFQFGDKVRVKSGFFENAEGFIEDIKKDISENISYWFIGYHCSRQTMKPIETFIQETDLERI